MASEKGFTRSEVVRMINLYRDYECLWNYKSSTYKRVDLKKRAWEEISRRMACGVEETKKKMKSLRSSYLSEKKKVDASRRSGTAADNIYSSSLFYYDEFKFIDGAIVLRKSTSNFQQDTDEFEQNPTLFDDNPTQDLYDEFNGSDLNEINGVLMQRNSERPAENHNVLASTPFKTAVRQGKINRSGDEFNGDLTQSTVDETLTYSTPVKTLERNRKRNKSDVSSKYQAAIDAVVEMAKPRDTTDENDMFVMFAKSLALQLKQMPMQNAVTAMSEIQQVVSGHMLRSVCGHVTDTPVLVGSSAQPVISKHQSVIAQHPTTIANNIFRQPPTANTLRQINVLSDVHLPNIFHESEPSTSGHINISFDNLSEDILNSEECSRKGDIIQQAMLNAGIFINEDDDSL